MRGFWLKVLKAGGGISSKRLMGVICVFFAMIFACLGLFLGEVGAVDGIVSTIVIEFLAAGVALFGITGWERRGQHIPPMQETYQEDPYQKDPYQKDPYQKDPYQEPCQEQHRSDNDNEEILDA